MASAPIAEALPKAEPAAWSWGRMLLGVALLLTLYRMVLVQHAEITLFVDEAYYWYWSRELAWGYFSKPPLIAWLIAAGTSLWGDSVLGVKAPVMLLYPLTAMALFGLGRQLFGERTGAVAALIFITSPMAGLLGLAASTDGPLLLCWTLATWALWRSMQVDQMRDWALLGLAVGVGLLVKYTMAAFVPTVLILLWPQRRRRSVQRGLLLAAGLALLCVLPHGMWNLMHGAPTLRHTAEITGMAQRAGGWPALGEFLGGQLGLLGPLAAGLLLWASPALWRRDHPVEPQQRFLLTVSLPLLVMAVVQAWHAGANMNWAAPSFLGLTLLLAHVLAPAGQGLKRAALLAVVASNVLLVSTICHAPAVARSLGQPLSEHTDFFHRMRGWDTAFANLEPAVAAHPGWPVLAQGRTLRAHAAYAWRAKNVRVLGWRTSGPPTDQFDLDTKAQPYPGSRLLLLSEDGPPPQWAARCGTLRTLGQTRVAVSSTRFVALHLAACEGWLASKSVEP